MDGSPLWRTERNDDDDAETIIIITLAHNERVIIITHTVCFIMRYMEEGQGGIRELGGKRSYRNTKCLQEHGGMCAQLTSAGSDRDEGKKKKKI